MWRVNPLITAYAFGVQTASVNGVISRAVKALTLLHLETRFEDISLENSKGMGLGALKGFR